MPAELRCWKHKLLPEKRKDARALQQYVVIPELSIQNKNKTTKQNKKQQQKGEEERQAAYHFLAAILHSTIYCS